jgi:hypothetical protein
MQYLVATYKFNRGHPTKLINVADDVRIEEVRKNLWCHGWITMIVKKPPSKRTLRRWKQENRARAIDNCWVVGYCSCSHGKRSWLNILGV